MIRTEPEEKASRARPRVNAWDRPYLEILQFLIDEAALLDDDRLEDWLALVADDAVYHMPVRVTRRRDQGAGFFPETGHYDDDHESLAFRIRKYTTAASSWSTNPPSRTRRLVTNLVVHETGTPAEYAATSSLLVTRTRWDEPKVDILSARREDTLRRSDATTWRIAKRLILVDQSTVATTNLAIFL